MFEDGQKSNFLWRICEARNIARCRSALVAASAVRTRFTDTSDRKTLKLYIVGNLQVRLACIRNPVVLKMVLNYASESSSRLDAFLLPLTYKLVHFTGVTPKKWIWLSFSFLYT